MANVKKTSKIDLYKFVPTGNVTGKSNPMVRTMVSNVAAVNNLGKTVNSIGAVVVDIKKTNLARLEQEKKNRIKFKPKFTTPKKQGLFKWLGKLKKGAIPGFLDSLLGFLMGLLKMFVILPIMKWVADPKNREKVKMGIELAAKIFKAIAWIAQFGTNNIFNGLYEMLADDSTWWERLVGFGKFLVGFGSLALAFRWLNPLNIMTTIHEIKFLTPKFFSAIKNAHTALGAFAKGPFGFMFIGTGLFASGKYLAEWFPWMVNRDANTLKEQEKQMEESGNTVEEQIAALEDQLANLTWFERWIQGKDKGILDAIEVLKTGKSKPHTFAQGGWLPQFANGGWIHGPQSGYPVSVDGIGPSFIGHGTEYVAGGKSDGSSYIIPFDTKATRANPNLTAQRMDEAKRLGYDIGGLSRAIGGMVDKKIYLHWTGSAYNNLAKGTYHSIFQGGGNKVQTADYDQQLNHTYKRNKNSVGLAIAAMGGKGWDEFPPTSPQLIGMMKEAARIGMSWGMKPKDVSRKTVMTQAEAASNRDGGGDHENYGPVDWGGTGERWGLYKLRKNDPDGSGGDRLRSMMRSFMQLPGKRKAEQKKIDKSEFNLLQRLVLAEARGEGVTGMALVARAVLQRQALIKQTGNPGLFNAKGDTLTDVIMGKGQFQPIADGSIDGKFSEDEYKRAAIAIRLAQNSRALRDRIMAEGFEQTAADNLLASTGFRTKSAFNDPSQNVNRVKYGNHIFNTAGNTTAKDLLAQRSNDKYSQGDGPGVPFVEGGLLRGKRGSREEAGFGVGANNNRVSNVSGAGHSRGRPTIGRPVDDKKIKKQTEDRNRARREMNARTLQIVQNAVAAVEKKNNESRNYVAQANAMAQNVLSSANTPTLVGGGGGGGRRGGGGSGGRMGGLMGTAVNLLNSFNNPLRGIFG